MSFDEVKRVARSLNWNVQTSSSNHNLFGLQHAFHGSTNVGYGRHSTEIRKQVAAILIAWQDGYDSAIIDLASN